ncbi:MAG: ribosome recycling factor [Patescibacteria group bacterium]
MIDNVLKELEGQLKNSAEKLRQELQGVRSNRPSVELVENISVVYFDQPMTIKQLASLGVKMPREIDITVWDHNAVNPIMKAIQDAGIGLSLSNEGNMIRAFLPVLTEERRQELTKIVKKMAEEVRIRVRGHRDDGNKKIKSAEAAKELNEDEAFKAKEKIQKLTDEANKQIEAMVESKFTELQE